MEAPAARAEMSARAAAYGREIEPPAA